MLYLNEEIIKYLHKMKQRRRIYATFMTASIIIFARVLFVHDKKINKLQDKMENNKMKGE